MMSETLLRALKAVRVRLAAAETDWLAERDRRRRQEAAFLRGIIRRAGSQRKAGIVTGISPRTIARLLDPQGHQRARDDDPLRRGAASFQKLAAPTAKPNEEPVAAKNVINMRQRDPEWKPREPRHGEIGE